MCNHNTQTHTGSHLGKTHSPKRDGQSRKIKTPRLSEMLEQNLKLCLYNSRLGEFGSLEREVQTLTLLYAHDNSNCAQTHTNSYQFIQYQLRPNTSMI